jgi:hypothetical protein
LKGAINLAFVSGMLVGGSLVYFAILIWVFSRGY